MASRQSVGYLADRLRRAGLKPVGRYGQNFLIDLNLVDLIVRTADLATDDVVLEIGTGTGSLTSRMADLAGEVVSVEIDPNLAQLAREELGDRPNVTLLECDALRNKNQLEERVLQAVRDACGRVDSGAGFKLVANLPYNVATPILSNLLLSDPIPSCMVVTIQKEVADRITASPGTKDYGSLSIWVQAVAQARIVRVLPPAVFWPRPKVHSAIVRIDPSAEQRARIADVDYFHGTVRALFLHRRKFLRSVLIHALQEVLDKPAVDRLLAEAGLSPQQRAEQLSVETMIDLVQRIGERVAKR